MLIDKVDALRGALVEDQYYYCPLIWDNLITLVSLVFVCLFWLEMKIGGLCSFELFLDWRYGGVSYVCMVLAWLKSRVEICENGLP